MKVSRLLGLGTVLLLAGLPAMAQTAPEGQKTKSPPTAKPATKGSDADELAAIRKSSQEFVKAFNDGDAHAVAGLWTEDGDYTDETGRVLSGREAIEKEYAALFTTKKGARIQIVIDSLRLLSPGAAIEDGRAMLESGRAGGMTKSVAVHVKVGGKWLMSTVRDSLIEASPSQRDMEDLEWLVGTWTTEDYGSHTESVCRWVLDKSFIERTYTVKHPDETTSSGIQIIGFNPQGGHVQSWNFSSDGGFAIGIWSRQEKGWSAEVSGATGNGTGTTAMNLLTRIDDNAYSWQSVSRTAGGVSMPDTDEVVVKRTKASR